MKYEITKLKHSIHKGLFRIKALKDYRNVKQGEFGGYVQSYDNLSQDGDCWIFNDACVFENAQVYGDAKILGNAKVYGNAQVYKGARVFGNARIYGKAKIFGYAEIHGYARVYENAKVYGASWIDMDAEICGDSKIELNRQYFCHKITKGQVTKENFKVFLKVEKWFPYFTETK